MSPKIFILSSFGLILLCTLAFCYFSNILSATSDNIPSYSVRKGELSDISSVAASEVRGSQADSNFSLFYQQSIDNVVMITFSNHAYSLMLANFLCAYSNFDKTSRRSFFDGNHP